MWTPLPLLVVRNISSVFFIFIMNISALNAQSLLHFVDDCNSCIGNVKRIVTKQKLDFDDFESPYIYKREDFNTSQQLIKSEISIGANITKTIHYEYNDSLILYEHHVSPGKKDFYLVYQYYQEKLPGKIIKVNKKRQILDYAELFYTKNYKPAYIEFYNLLGEVLRKQSVEYYSGNQIVIRFYNAKSQNSNLQKHELFCKFNSPKKLRKKDFKDLITRPINLEVEDDFVRIVNGVKTDTKEVIRIEELTYDDHGNWTSKKTYELKKNKTKRKLVNEIKREIEYY